MNSSGLGSLGARYQNIVSQIPSSVTLIAVSKKQPVEAIEELYRLGHRDFGENYAQEMVSKAQELERRGCAEIRWHFIGHLQTNKIKMILPFVNTIHAVDSEKLVTQLSRQVSVLTRAQPLPVFIEVNLDQEQTKSGVHPAGLRGLAETVSRMPELSLQGLMCIPEASQEPRSRFKELKELEQRLRPLTQGGLSMGMSSDYLAAIQEGATHLRVGTALFGFRDRP